MLAPPNPVTVRPRAIAIWLLTVAALVFVMIIVGGITRLTESGLSITRWELVTGILPPMSEAEWEAAFDLYRQSPQGQLLERGMTMADFRFIYFWEYIHRLLGRVIGIAFALPLIWFAVRKAIPRGYGWKLGALFLLGGLQGAVGWWMVASGLVDVPEVSHVRLAIHLLLAFAIFGALIWVALDLLVLARQPIAQPARLPVAGIWTLALLAIQMLFGAYVAGLEAGYAFNTWPLMGDELYPEAAPWLDPWLQNFVDNPITVQFIHRWMAFVAAAGVLWLAARNWHLGDRRVALLAAGAVFVQIALGIATILSGVKLWIGVAHQGMAALLLAAVLLSAHRLGTTRL